MASSYRTKEANASSCTTEGSERIFVHHSGIAGDANKFLENGGKVAYEAARGGQGMEAKNVSKI